MADSDTKSLDPTYWEYIRLDQLLNLQGGIEGGDVETVDELHFIVIHQAIELCFKLVIRELRESRRVLAQDSIREEHIQEAALHLARVNEGLAVCSTHFTFMEALGTQGFLSFRDKLGSSSGAQSFQMREVEALLGMPQSERVKVLERLRRELPDAGLASAFEGFILDPLKAIVDRIEGQIAVKEAQGMISDPDVFVRSYVRGALEDIEQRGTVRSNLFRWLFRTPITDSEPGSTDDSHQADQEAVRAFVDDYLRRGEGAGWAPSQVKGAEQFLRGGAEAPLDWPTERARAALLFIETYADLPLLAWPRLLLDRLVELESRLVAFRNEHARTVERIIGDRPGTGGSAGIRYLDLTRDARVFPELAVVRGILIPRAVRAPLTNTEGYGFTYKATD